MVLAGQLAGRVGRRSLLYKAGRFFFRLFLFKHPYFYLPGDFLYAILMLMKIAISKRAAFIAITAAIVMSLTPLLAQTEESPSEVIKKQKVFLKTAKDSAKIAEAHYEMGLALEKLGRETEATAEYLKIIVNYPDLGEINKKSEKRLSGLYSGFSERAEELAGEYESVSPQKDPTIFFAYIKSLYENHRNMGQYDKALGVLKTLYEMDPSDSSYIIDMGGIYLYGYNDAEEAAFHFRKAIDLNPDNPRAYAGLGRAYEKKEDYDSAISAYSKASDVAPASPWAIYSLRRVEGIRLTKDKRLVKDWFFIGPFDNSDTNGLETKFPPEEKIDLKAVYTGKDDLQVGWIRPFNYDSSGYVDLNSLFVPNDYTACYALTYAHSPNDREAQFRFGAEDGIKIWVNDKEVASYGSAKSSEVDGDMIKVSLKKGWNKIMLKVSDTWGAWGFYFRVTDLRGNSTEDIVFDPVKDNDRLEYIYKKLVKEKRTRITKIAVIYALGFSFLFLGLYFMISNIHSKIKINRMKEDFISSVSHELKTPIAAVRMLAETLKRGKVKQEVRKIEYYDMMIRESDRLTRFIGKILDFARLEKGGKIFYFEKENVASVAKSAADTFKDETQDEVLNISFNSESEDIFAEIDKDAIFQVIFNLLDNAYKYSKENKDISVNVKGGKEDVRIEVIDKGPGMSKETIEKIFEKFYRGERDMMQGIKGSGLGLAFVKSVIQAHDGKIAVESELGKGSKFIISLPVEKV